MIIDTSAWVEFLRGTGSPTHLRLREEIVAGGDLRVPELVVMELLVGPATSPPVRRLRTLLHSFEVIPLAPLVDSEAAAGLQRQCRAAGRTVRNMIDCLVAATALRLDQPVLQQDRDFDAMAAVCGLTLVEV